MAFVVFVIAVTVAVSALILHSLLSNGRHLTFSFFFFAFLWAFRKESTLPFSFISPYNFTAKNAPAVLVTFTIILGWIFAFYISWHISEAILERVGFLKKRLFATLLLGMWIMACISYAVESTGVNIGWWQWKIGTQRFSDFFVSGYRIEAMGGWVDFFIYFMAAYLLIECSKYKKVIWKNIFFLIPCSYMWFYLLREFSVVRTCVINGIIVLAFINPLGLEYEREKPEINPAYLKIWGRLPLGMAFFMALTLFGIDVLITKQPRLFFSKLPIIICVLFAIKKIPIPILVILSGAMFILGGKLAIPAIIVLAFILSLKTADWLKIRSFFLIAQQDSAAGNIAAKKNIMKFSCVTVILIAISISYFILSPYTSILSASSKNKVNVSGEVVFNNYKSGAIRIGAWSSPFVEMLPPDLAHTQIDKPGPFRLRIPGGKEKIYLHAVNIPEAFPAWLNSSKQDFPSGDYEKNPLEIKTSDIAGVIILVH